MDENEFIKERLDDQISWYDKKSQWNQKYYKVLRIIEIIAAATIPLVAGLMTAESMELKFLVGFLGLMIAVITGAVTLYKFQENWIKYRTTCEMLKHEKYFYLTKTNQYNLDDPFPLLVKRVENIISKENMDWEQNTSSSKKE